MFITLTILNDNLNRCKMRRKSYLNLAKKLKSPPPAQVAIENLEKEVEELIVDKLASTESKTTTKTKDEGRRILKKTFKQVHKMSNDDLEMLLTSKDNFVIDCLLNDHVPALAKLEQERDALQVCVHDLADCNYAREPEFVQARLKLRETLDDVNEWRRRVTGRHLNPIIEKLNKAQEKLAEEARSLEKQSEQMAEDFLHGSKSLDLFIEDYIKLRKETSQKRILADRLAKEKNMLAVTIPRQMDSSSPIPAPRQKKRVSFNR